MPEPSPATTNDGLVLHALLYFTGELDPPTAAAFEEQLGGDVAAQTALCRAVELVQAQRPMRPHPRYRRRVRRRLLPTPRERVARRALSVRGLTAALIVFFVCFGLAPTRLAPPPPPTFVADATDELAVATRWAELSVLADSHLAKALHQAAAPAEDDGEESADDELWAALNDREHLAQAHKEFVRRQTDGQRKRESRRGD